MYIKRLLILVALCGPGCIRLWVPVSEAASKIQDKGQDKAICAVCGPREGAGAEPIKTTATYKGKAYAFCSLPCKVEFLENPQQFLVTDEGKPAPAFTLKNLQGQNVSLSDFKGKVVLADFWGSFCIPCIEALPYLESLYKKYQPQGFVMMGISVDEDKKVTTKLAQKARVTYPILMSTPQVWGAYKVNTLPSLVLIGRDGRIIKRYGGEADKKAMVAEIKRALAVSSEAAPTEKGATP